MNKYFKVDAQSILTLGRDSIKDHTTAIVELVKNAYDADADWVHVSINVGVHEPFIRVSDNGTGMTENDIEDKWLRIGFSDKNETGNKISRRGRRKTGEKGVGRLSAARLGEILEIRTNAAGKNFGLEINWAAFDLKGRILHEIPLRVIPNVSIDVPPNSGFENVGSGTELLIKTLAQEWSLDDLDKLERELSLLISPFITVRDFTILLTSDVDGFIPKPIESEMYEGSLVTLNAEYDSRSNAVSYTTKIIDEHEKSYKNISISQLIGRRSQPKSLRCGPVSLTLLMYLQKDDPFEGVSLSKQDIRTFLENNAGIKIYRDDVRVKPYGDLREPEGDWLELGKRYSRNPAGAAREGFRAAPNRIVGAVFLSRDKNPSLIDSTSREGLIKGDAFKDLMRLLIGCVRLLETTYHLRFLAEKEKERGNLSSIQRVQDLSQNLKEIFKDIEAIRPVLADNEKYGGTETIERLEEVRQRLPDIQYAIRDLQSQNMIFRGLATIGIASAVFGHETEILTAALLNSLGFIKKAIQKSRFDSEKVLGDVEDAVDSAQKIGSWGEFALARVRRDKRRRKPEEISEIVRTVLDELAPPFRSVDIEVRRKLKQVEAVTIAMDVEAILINLLTNAYSAVLDEPGKRVIRVEVHRREIAKKNGFEIVVADTGAGVLKQFEGRIWEPLFSTKSDSKKRQIGTGLGLSIVDSIINDFGGTRSYERDELLHGARFSVWLPSS